MVGRIYLGLIGLLVISVVEVVPQVIGKIPVKPHDSTKPFQYNCLPQNSDSCTGGFQNGICIAPGRCYCNVGFILSESNKCEPICDDGCKNGYCMGPGLCFCNQGFYMTESFGCKPVCSFGCQNGVCIAPEVCSCNAGYFKSDTNECKPM